MAAIVVGKRVFSLAVVLALLLTLAFVVMPASPAKAATLCVNPGGTGGCYSTIQAAIAAANPNDTINVAAGTYDESLDITKPLTILGQGQATTFIDRSANATAGNVVFIHALSGNVKVDGFTIKTGPASSVNSNGIVISGLTGPGTITISNNTIWGVQSAAATAMENYCVIAGYFTATTPKLVFDHNTVHGGSGGNPILIERWMGPTEITNNILDNGIKNYGSSDVIFMMNHSGSHNTQKQLISDNTIDMGWGTIYDSSHRGTGISVVGSYTPPGGVGGFTDVQITNNQISNVKAARRGIGLTNLGATASNGDIVNAIISGNTITGATTGSVAASMGIFTYGLVTNATITGNTITGLDNSFKERLNGAIVATGTKLNWNNFDVNTNGVYTERTAGTLNAENNWWGDASGPSGVGLGSGDAVSANVTYAPWLIAAVGDSKTETVTDSTVNAIAEASTEVVVTGTATVTAASYSGNPPGSGFTGDVGKYIDVHVSGSPTEIEIRLYFTSGEVAGPDESSLRMMYWNGSAWVACSDTGVNQSANYIWAKIRSDTTPDLTYLSGGPFGGSGGGAGVPVFPSVPIGIAAVLAAGFVAFALRKRIVNRGS